MNKLYTMLLFYKPFLWWSFGINVALGVVKSHLILAAIVKLFLLIFIWFYVHETHHKRRLMFFKNLGWSTKSLFSTVFIVDVVLTLSFLVLFKEFT